MKKYMLNNMGDCWIFRGDSEEDAEKEYIRQMGFDSVKEYQLFCSETGQSALLEWKEV